MRIGFHLRSVPMAVSDGQAEGEGRIAVRRKETASEPVITRDLSSQRERM